MKSRSAILRERSRRVFRWSFGAAVLLHLVAFVFWPAVHVEPMGSALEVTEPVDQEDEGDLVDVVATFMPPRIQAADGRWVREPPDRVLAASRAVRLPASCLGPDDGFQGEVRLRLNAEGRVELIAIEQGTGSSCGDRAMRAVAADLWYRWLPDERYPAPVDLVQPVQLRLMP